MARNSARSTLLMSSFVIGIAAMSVAAAAETSSPAPANAVESSSAGSGALEEIVVTAQRVETNLQRTPLSVTVLSGSMLAEESIISESDLQSAVPGLTVRGAQDSNQLNYSLRGQTVDVYSSSLPAVLPYVNEVQVSTGSSSAFYDLQSIQVLKGPQGTLFGRNATGGAVLFTTVKPTDEFGGYVTARGGDYSLGSGEGALNIPVVKDKVLLRIAGFYEYRDGFQYNTVDDATIGTIRRAAGRLSLLLKPTDDLSSSTVFDYSNQGGSNTAPVAYSAAPPCKTNALLPATCLAGPTLDSAIGVSGAWAAYLAAHPNVYPGGLYAFTALQNARGPYTISINGNLPHNAESSSVSNITTYDVNSDTQFKNIFGYSHSLTRDFVDIDGSPYVVEGSGPTGTRTVTTQYSEEPQILGKVFAGKLSYVAGFYYSDATYYSNTNLVLLSLEPIIPGSPDSIIGQTKSTSYAGYTQGTYEFGDSVGIKGLGITAGARYTSEDDSSMSLPGSANYNVPGTASMLSSSTHKPSYQFGVQEQVDPDLFLYAVTRHSFRNGGFNLSAKQVPGFAAAGGAGFLPETDTDVEVGAKFQGLLGSLPSRINVAAFTQWADNVQRVIYYYLSVTDNGALTVNIPKARVQGFEGEVQIDPSSWLRLGISGAYTMAKFTDNRAGVLGSSQTYGPYPDTPKWSGAAFTQASIPLPNEIGALTIRADAYAQTSFLFGSQNDTVNPGTSLPGYALVNFRVGVDNIRHSGWSASASVRNAFNHVYYVGGLPTYALETVNTALPGDPRTYVFEATYKF